LASDLVEAHDLMPGISIDWLADGLVMLPDGQKADLIVNANELRSRQPRV
jgi:hypothetical protein